MATKNEIKGFLSQIKSASNEIKSRIVLLDDEIQGLYDKRNELLSASLSKEDYIEAVRASIRAKAKGFKFQLGRLLKDFPLTYPRAMSADVAPLNISFLDAGLTARPGLSEEGFYYYFEDAILDGAERALEGKKWPVDAMPAADRKAALEGIDAQIAKLTAERDALADDLVLCGVTE
jgi:hypothetical protein